MKNSVSFPQGKPGEQDSQLHQFTNYSWHQWNSHMILTRHRFYAVVGSLLCTPPPPMHTGPDQSFLSPGGLDSEQ